LGRGLIVTPESANIWRSTAFFPAIQPGRSGMTSFCTGLFLPALIMSRQLRVRFAVTSTSYPSVSLVRVEVTFWLN
jgi:hypothetical protein